MENSYWRDVLVEQKKLCMEHFSFILGAHTGKFLLEGGVI